MEEQHNKQDTSTSRNVQGMDANEVFKKRQLAGEPAEIDSLFGRKLLLTAIAYIEGNKGRFAVMQFKDTETGHTHVLSNGSKIVLEKIDMLVEDSQSAPNELGHIEFKTPYKISIISKISSSKQEYHDIIGWD